MIDDGLRELEDVQGNPTFVYRGRHWACSTGPLTRGVDLGLGAPVSQLSRTITVRKTAIVPIRTVDENENWTADGETPLVDADTMPPHVGKSVVLEARNYQVRSVTETEASWRVELESPN